MAAGRDFDEITVSAFCAAAEVSQSSFYNLFEDKNALLDSLVDRLIEQDAERFSRDFPHLDWDQDPVEIVRQILRLLHAARAENLGFRVSIGIAELKHDHVRERIADFDRTHTDLLVELFIQRMNPPADQVAEVRARMAFAAVAIPYWLATAFTPPSSWAAQVDIDDNEVIDRLAEMWEAYCMPRVEPSAE